MRSSKQTEGSNVAFEYLITCDKLASKLERRETRFYTLPISSFRVTYLLQAARVKLCLVNNLDGNLLDRKI